MKYKILAALIGISLVFTACSPGGNPAAITPEAIPTVKADAAIIAEGRLEPVRYAEIAFNASGLVSEVLVSEGEQVEAGQVIARLESQDAKTLEAARAAASEELTAAYQGVRDAQFKFDNFDVPSDFSGLTPPEAVAQTLEKLNAARAAYEPYRYLGANNDMRRENKKRLENAWAKYRKAIQWMELDSNLAAANARLIQAQKDFSALQDAAIAEDTAGARAALANAELRAPFSGILINLDLKVGEYASSGQTVVTIADTSGWLVKTTDLTEIEVVQLAEGQPVVVTLDALPGVELNGFIHFIGQSYSENQGDVVYEVTVLLTNTHPAMRWGMTAAVRFENED